MCLSSISESQCILHFCLSNVSSLFIHSFVTFVGWCQCWICQCLPLRKARGLQHHSTWYWKTYQESFIFSSRRIDLCLIFIKCFQRHKPPVGHSLTCSLQWAVLHSQKLWIGGWRGVNSWGQNFKTLPPKPNTYHRYKPFCLKDHILLVKKKSLPGNITFWTDMAISTLAEISYIFIFAGLEHKLIVWYALVILVDIKVVFVYLIHGRKQ